MNAMCSWFMVWTVNITLRSLVFSIFLFAVFWLMLLSQVLLMTLQNAPPGLDYERDKRFSKVCCHFDDLYVFLKGLAFHIWYCLEYSLKCGTVHILLLSDVRVVWVHNLVSRRMQSFKEMIAMCLVKEPSKRPTAEKLLRHSFFKHARTPDYIYRHILEGLPPLGDRLRNLQVRHQNFRPCVCWCSVCVRVRSHNIYMHKYTFLNLRV